MFSSALSPPHGSTMISWALYISSPFSGDNKQGHTSETPSKAHWKCKPRQRLFFTHFLLTHYMGPYHIIHHTTLIFSVSRDSIKCDEKTVLHGCDIGQRIWSCWQGKLMHRFFG